VLTEAASGTPVIIHVDQIVIAGPAQKRVVEGSTVVIRMGGSFQALESREVIADQMVRASRELGGPEAETVNVGSHKTTGGSTIPLGKNACAICGGSRVANGIRCGNCSGLGYT